MGGTRALRRGRPGRPAGKRTSPQPHPPRRPATQRHPRLDGAADPDFKPTTQPRTAANPTPRQPDGPAPSQLDGAGDSSPAYESHPTTFSVVIGYSNAVRKANPKFKTTTSPDPHPLPVIPAAPSIIPVKTGTVRAPSDTTRTGVPDRNRTGAIQPEPYGRHPTEPVRASPTETVRAPSNTNRRGVLRQDP